MSGGRYRSWRNWGARAHVVQRHGLDAVVLENAVLRLQVLAGRGTDVIECNYKPRDMDFVSLSQEGLRPPGTAGPSAPDATGSFLDVYRGGWQEVVPNGGGPSQHAGASHGQHGEACLIPWDHEIVEDAEQRVAVRFEALIPRTPLRVEKTLTLDAASPRIEVVERLTNHSPVGQRAMWGQHLAFGSPFLSSDCRILLEDGVRVIPHGEAIGPSGRRVDGGREHAWPRATAPDGATVELDRVPERGTPSELLYLTGFDRGRYALVDADGFGVRVEWDADRLPYLWLWQELGATTDYPWFGRTYLMGLEPFSSYPTTGLADAVRNDSALRIGPHESVDLTWSVEVVGGEEQR
ncbi:hypothetical protein DSM104299_03602 [Baekduia alba]|uniref:DUF4432 family protein n=1 Tax=Baekduia alba TaxID=2997333 RepID=UPI0023414330|nr:DUF4432 family protein [Baekduia alba]WCB94862.1 hypothetical protein DSM104299_03602 [Baekduia alba]